MNIAEVLLMLIKYALTNSLSLTAIISLFGLINCIFVELILPETRYFIKKLFNPSHCTTFHGLCTLCGNNIGTFTRIDSSKRCDLCAIDINVKDSMYKDFFVTLNPANKIPHLLEENSNYDDYVINERFRREGVIRHIYDGKL